jgi:DNA polymerase-1
MNLQNIPVAEKAKIKSDTYVKLPNIRKLFIPDPGYTFFDMDLDRADLQVVVWEADDQDLKSVLRQNLDMHCVNACDIFDLKGIPREELQETHPNYRDHRARIGEAFRNKSKAGVHATNYGVGDRKLAEALGITVHEASRFRARWFAAHPGIRRWHLRIEDEATKRGFISTRFGARMYTLGRIDLPQLLAWQPQSTVAGVINRALLNIDEAAQKGETSVQLLIQVHDSLAGQFRTIDAPFEVAMLKKLARVPIPYEDPLIIPVGINTSGVSWGHCK